MTVRDDDIVIHQTVMTEMMSSLGSLHCSSQEHHESDVDREPTRDHHEGETGLISYDQTFQLDRIFRLSMYEQVRALY